VCALLDKEERREISVPIHYRGFKHPKRSSFLDMALTWMNITVICLLSPVVDLEKYKPPE